MERNASNNNINKFTGMNNVLGYGSCGGEIRIIDGKAINNTESSTKIGGQDISKKWMIGSSLVVSLLFVATFVVVGRPYSTSTLTTVSSSGAGYYEYAVDSDSSAAGIRTGISMGMSSIIRPSDRVVFGPNWSSKEEGRIIFCGHAPAPDIDSVASAIGAAELYNGVAAIPPKDINSETSYVLNRFGVEKPKFVKELLQEIENAEVVMVDVNADGQITKDIPRSKIVGIIDHHGVNEFVKNARTKPMMVLIEPWGSACTIITALFQAQGKTPTKATAGCLLAGILSDTLNLSGPTTSGQDESAVNWLSKIVLKDPDPSILWNQKEAVYELFNSQSIAKANLTGYDDTQIITSDIKTFTCVNKDDAMWGTVEGVDPFYSEYLEYPRICEWGAVINKNNKGGESCYTFISFVEIQKLSGIVMTTGLDAGKKLEDAFGTTPLFDNTTTTTLCEGMTIIKTVSAVHPTQGRVSRKDEFMPPIIAECKK